MSKYFSKLKTFIAVFLSVTVMICLSTILLPTLLILYIISMVHFLLLKLKYGNRICKPRGMDMAYGLENPMSKAYCHFVATIGGKLTLQQLKEHVRKKFQLNDFPIANRRLRRYQQIYTKVAGYKYFIDDINFDIDNHFFEVTKADLYDDPQLRKNPNDIRSFIEDKDSADDYQLFIDHFMKKYGNIDMDEDKPQWQFYCFKDGDKFAFMLRFNHVISDGVHFVRFLYEEFSDVRIIQKMPFYYKESNLINRLRRHIRSYLLLPLAFNKILANYGNNPLHGQKLTGKKTRIVSEAIPLKHVKEIKNACEVKFNTVLFSCIAYAMRCYYREKQAHIRKTYVIIPVSRQDLRKEIKTKNSHGIMPITLTTEPKDAKNDSALTRLKRIEKDINDATNDESVQSIQLSLRMFSSVLPHCMSVLLFNNVKGVTAGMSNMPGPEKEPLRIGNAYTNQLIFWVPDKDPNGVSVGYLGNTDTLRVSLQIDWGIMKTNEEAYSLLQNFIKEIYNLRNELGLDPVKHHTEIHLDK